MSERSSKLSGFKCRQEHSLYRSNIDPCFAKLSAVVNWPIGQSAQLLPAAVCWNNEPKWMYIAQTDLVEKMGDSCLNFEDMRSALVACVFIDSIIWAFGLLCVKVDPHTQEKYYQCSMHAVTIAEDFLEIAQKAVDSVKELLMDDTLDQELKDLLKIMQIGGFFYVYHPLDIYEHLQNIIQPSLVRES